MILIDPKQSEMDEKKWECLEVELPRDRRAIYASRLSRAENQGKAHTHSNISFYSKIVNWETLRQLVDTISLEATMLLRICIRHLLKLQAKTFKDKTFGLFPEAKGCYRS